jgi:CDP-paratose 2-epimerase
MTARQILITGGAGFVGTNLAAGFAGAGDEVTVLDDLSRPGVETNLAWLRGRYPRVRFVRGDVRDARTVRSAMRGAGVVCHLAAQVAVTTSLVDPREDFSVNAAGTLTVLVEARRQAQPPGLIFTSTNKVYGDLADVALRENDGRHEPVEEDHRRHGISEQRPLRFLSPYGCSKGAADQYVLDYAHSFGLHTVVFRMSCIYGPHQQGTEDQGWVAHFLRRAAARAPLTIYGDGRQVRDVLHVSDLVRAFRLAAGALPALAGRAFNLGGGPGNTLSLRELLSRIEALSGSPVDVAYDDWRVGDQRWYVSDTRAFAAATGWAPQVGVAEGVADLHAWLRTAHPELAAAAGR